MSAKVPTNSERGNYKEHFQESFRSPAAQNRARTTEDIELHRGIPQRPGSEASRAYLTAKPLTADWSGTAVAGLGRWKPDGEGRKRGLRWDLLRRAASE